MCERPAACARGRRARQPTARFAKLRATHPYLDQPGPIGFAHRGGAAEAPENTLPAFQAAIDLGYRYLETDALVTRDGVLVAFHDDRLDRVSDRSEAIAELDFAEVASADVGYRFSADGGHTHPYRGVGLSVPRLEELFMRWPQASLNIDPKSEACVEALVELIDRFDAWDRVCLGAVAGARRRRIAALSGGRACIAMTSNALALARISALAGAMSSRGADCIQMSLADGPTPIYTTRFVRAAHRAGLPVHAWTVNEKRAMEQLLDVGVDGIMTDRPKLLRAVFAARGLEVGGGASPSQ